MADDTSSTASTREAATVVDDALHAAEGTRTASRWLALALGAIPSLAVLGAILRSPGDAGFNGWLLSTGVILAAIGALIGVLGFARVVAPVGLEESKVREKVPLSRLPAVSIPDWIQLDNELEGARKSLIDAEERSETRSEAATELKVEAQGLAAIAEESEALAKASPNDEGQGRRAAEARLTSSLKEREAVAAEARATASAGRVDTWRQQVTRRLAVREQAYLLAASDEVRRRYLAAQWAAGFAVVFIASGVICLALAPNPKPPDSANVSLVTLTLNNAGKSALGCKASSVQALRTGGTADAPTVITLPQQGCPSKSLTFTTATPVGYGTVSTPK